MTVRQGPTGTRYPTRTRSFFQYPIRTRFVFKIIGYFGYRVFHKTMFLTWKMPLRSYKILTNIILYHLYLTKLDCHYFNVLWANCNGNLLHNYIIPVFPWVLYMGSYIRHQIETRLSTMEEQHRSLWEQLIYKVSKKDVINELKS